MKTKKLNILNMKNTLILIFVFASNFYLSNKSYSQKVIFLNTVSANGYNLNKFSKIDVINNLPDSNILGYIPSDVLNDRKFIKSPDAITPWLQSFVNKQFASNPDIKSKKFLWIIQDLSMGKDSTQKQGYSFLKLKADIYESTGLNYQLVNTFDSTWVTTNSNVDFGKMIAQSFIDLYKNSVEQVKGAANVRFQQLAGKPSGTKDDLIRKVIFANNLPILKASDYKDGVYTSFEEFKNNTPSITNFYADVDSQSNKIELYQIASDSSSQLIQKAWGISVNDELYFYKSGQLYPIEKSGNTFYMAKYLEPRTRKNQAFYWRKIIGVRQGDANPFNDAHVLRKNVSTANNISLEATHLDFEKEDFIY